MNRSQAEQLIYELLIEADRDYDVVIDPTQARRLAKRLVDAILPEEEGAP